MARLDWEHVVKRFGADVAVADLSLSVGDGELLTILGPSGCGKSTLLRLTAGLETLSSGAIRLDGKRIDDVAPHARDVAMVFQSYALYPHLSVCANIEFPLRMRGASRDERRHRVEEMAALLELDELLERRPAQLSGGQRQRVALARALVRRPAVFLLDEPLSNLDARLRLSVRQHIRQLQRRLGVTTVYVTHDQTEAMTLGDRMVVLQSGRIQQVDRPAAVYESPANTFVAGFLGSPAMNLIPAAYRDGAIRVGKQELSIPAILGARLPAELMIGVRPEAFAATPGDTKGRLVAVPQPDTTEVLGNETLVRAAMDGAQLIARLPGIARKIPERLTVAFEQLHLFSAASGERIALT
jgi:ABC-type sugar transport system ATPase subunit